MRRPSCLGFQRFGRNVPGPEAHRFAFIFGRDCRLFSKATGINTSQTLSSHLRNWSPCRLSPPPRSSPAALLSPDTSKTVGQTQSFTEAPGRTSGIARRSPTASLKACPLSSFSVAKAPVMTPQNPLLHLPAPTHLRRLPRHPRLRVYLPAPALCLRLPRRLRVPFNSEVPARSTCS